MIIVDNIRYEAYTDYLISLSVRKELVIIVVDSLGLDKEYQVSASPAIPDIAIYRPDPTQTELNKPFYSDILRGKKKRKW